jgi:hypothetical protein
VVSCASIRDPEVSLRAACSAHQYLEANGFLMSPVADRSSIDLGMWDKLNFERDGIMDWAKLLADRHGRFSDRLYGVMANGSDQYLVAYKGDDSFSCVSVSSDMRMIHLIEAPCVPSGSIMKLVDHSLRCHH